MDKIKVYTLHSAILIILMVMIVFGAKAYQQALLYEDATTELVALQGAQEQAMLQLEKFATSILGTLVGDERQVNFAKVEQKRTLAMLNAQRYTRYFMYLLGAVLLSYFLVSLRTFTLFGSIAAMITLVLGLISPILMVTIHTQVEYLGDIVLSFESKGVIGSIVKLFDSGDVIVALVILLFSVIIPSLKVVTLLFVSIFMKSGSAHTLVKFFKWIGKWSMVDVFVVAVFLVYLTANKGEVSRAEVEVGLYFFLAYVIVSMMISITADKMMRDEK